MRYVVLFALLVLAACEPAGKPAPEQPALARPSDEAIAERVREVRERLSPDPAGQRVLGAIAAHGGLGRWYSNGPLSLHFFYKERTHPVPVSTDYLIDQWSARAVHSTTITNDSIPLLFGWDGTNAWQFPPAAQLPVNPRYWSLTPYYLLAFPFVMGDPGVVLALEGEEEFEGRLCRVIRMTFEPGTGASPDDYFVVYIDKETSRVAAVRFIVSYPGFFPNGGFFPDRIMIPYASEPTDGILLPDSLHIFDWTNGARSGISARAVVIDPEFLPEAEAHLFDALDDAALISGF